MTTTEKINRTRQVLAGGKNPKRLLVIFAFAVALPAHAFAQASLPSKEEVSELASKADQKISAFERAVRAAKPSLDEIDPELARNYLNAATAGHTVAGALQKNGPTAYALVGLLATLDDLSLDAANAQVQLLGTDQVTRLTGSGSNGAVLVFVIGLASAGGACNDVAELILHATLRAIAIEEQLLDTALEKQK